MTRRRRVHRGKDAAVAIAAVFVAGCTTAGSTTRATDAGTDASLDANPDGSADVMSGGDAPVVDVQGTPDVEDVVPVGTALVVVSGAQIRGVTDDGYVAYIDGSGAVSAVSIAGGAPRQIVAAGARDASVTYVDVKVSHGFVAVWQSAASAIAPATLTVWAAASGVAMQVATRSLPGVFEAAVDSTFFTYFDDAAEGTASLYGALADGSQAKALLSDVVVTELGGCFPREVVSGTYVVVASCLSTSFGGSDAPSVSSFDSAHGWQQASLVASAIDQVAVDPSGANVLAATSDGALEYIPIAGGAPVLVDPGNPVSTTPTSTSTLFVAKSPTRAIYQTRSNALKVAQLPSGLVTSLNTGSVGPIFGLSPDGTSVSYATPVADLTSGYPLDVSVISTMPGGSVIALERGNPAAVFYELGDPDSFSGTEFTLGTDYPFTTDSAYALLTTVPLGTQDDQPPGSLQATSIATGTTVVVSATSVFAAVPLVGSSVIWNDGYTSTGNALGGAIANLRVVDLAHGQPTSIIAGVDAVFAVSPDMTKAIYTLNYGTSRDGLYVVSVP